MKLRTFVLLLGIILIFVQAIAFLGMSRVPVGLYPDMSDVWSPNYFYRDSVPVERKLLFAFNAGFERFITSFSDLTFDIQNDIRNTTPTQYTSTFFRYSLRYDYFADVYDAILTFSYCITGITGLFLIIISPKIKQ